MVLLYIVVVGIFCLINCSYLIKEQFMTIQYVLHPNRLTADPSDHAARVRITGLFDLEGLTRRIMDQGSTVTRPDILAVLGNTIQAAESFLLEGFRSIWVDCVISILSYAALSMVSPTCLTRCGIALNWELALVPVCEGPFGRAGLATHFRLFRQQRQSLPVAGKTFCAYDVALANSEKYAMVAFRPGLN